VGEALSAALLPKKDLIPSGPDEAYKARPLEGIWATAPYLHNGSVPNLYELLLPHAKRTKQFCVGSREFDPTRVGFIMLSEAECKAKNLYWLDTEKEGNRNCGHEGPAFGVNSDEHIWALVEYLKSL
jgi:cytochrome c peroxidase